VSVSADGDGVAVDDGSPSPEAGSGLIATVGAVLVFIIFMLFAVQLLIGLYGRSVITGMAYDGAREVAGFQNRKGQPISVDDARRLAEGNMRREVGDMNVQFSWVGSTDDTVVLRVQADNPRFLWPGLSQGLATDHIDRTVRVRVEKLQDEPP
jgi:hypothetical protein